MEELGRSDRTRRGGREGDERGRERTKARDKGRTGEIEIGKEAVTVSEN